MEFQHFILNLGGLEWRELLLEFGGFGPALDFIGLLRQTLMQKQAESEDWGGFLGTFLVCWFWFFFRKWSLDLKDNLCWKTDPVESSCVGLIPPYLSYLANSQASGQLRNVSGRHTLSRINSVTSWGILVLVDFHFSMNHLIWSFIKMNKLHFAQRV